MAGDKEYLAEPPKVKVQGTVGAGDSAVAGFIYGLMTGKDLLQSLMYAAAAGTATTLTQGTAPGKMEDFEVILPNVKLTILQDHK